MEKKLLEFINILLVKKGKGKLDSIKSKISLREDLGFDSLDLAELTVRIEDETGVDIFESGNVDKISEIIEKLSKK